MDQGGSRRFSRQPDHLRCHGLGGEGYRGGVVQPAPSAAFLEVLGLNIGPVAPVAHFAYGILWALILLAVFGEGITLAKGLAVAGVQWLLFMVVFAPIIGRGFFGIGGPAHTLAANEPLYLGSPLKFLGLTLILHAIYGALNGWLIPRWIGARQGVKGASR